MNPIGAALLIIFFVVFVFIVCVAIFMHAFDPDRQKRKPNSKAAKPAKLERRKHTLNRDGIKRSSDKNIKLFFRELFSALDRINYYRTWQINIIRQCIKDYKEEATVNALKRLDVSKINRNKSRININTLKFYKYKTLYDIYCHTGSFIQYSGIGEVTDQAIRRNIKEIHDEIYNSTYVKLSYDNRTKASNNLTRNVAIYIDLEPYEKKAKELLQYRKAIDKLQKELKHALHNPLLLFRPKQALEDGLEIYNKIIAVYDEHFADIDEKIFNPVQKIIDQSNEQAWESFKQNPIAFNKVIEDVIGGSALQSEFYGLSESLASKVKKTPLNVDELKLSLRTYQEWGSKYMLCQKRTILGDEMGLGKTVQAIAAMVSLKHSGATHFMVICPLSVLTNWCREIYKFSSLNYYYIYSSKAGKRFYTWIHKGGVAVTTYETLNRLKSYSGFKIDFLVVDEAHYIKNPNTQRTSNALAFVNAAERVTYLTGTALENKVEEMIMLISHLNSSVAKEVSAFANFQSVDSFKSKVADVYFRRRREDVLAELPEKIEVDDWCDLNEIELSKYKDYIRNKIFIQARRVSWHVDPEHSTKLARLKEIVELAKEENRKVLVFSFFLDNLSLIKNYFKGDAYGPINGSVSAQERQAIIDKFSNAPAGSLLVCQIQSGGIGLNIQAASVVVICEPQFKPSTENQAISRAYRMGQARNVLVYHLLATNTVDERLNEILSTKQAIFDKFADKSLVAEDSFKIDESMFNNIMKDEYNRLINETGDENIDVNDLSEKEDETISEVKEIEKKPIEKKTFIPPIPGGQSVTGRINSIVQPRGGYIRPNMFSVSQLNDDIKLNEDENVPASLVGTAVDYLSRMMNGNTKEDSFHISLLGAQRVSDSEFKKAKDLLSNINGLDDNSIVSALRLVRYDVAFRVSPLHFDRSVVLEPNVSTIENVRTMVNRALSFFKQYGPITKDGFTFGKGYTKAISSGDGDFLTKDTLWDFKVTKNEITNKHTLQVLIYYLMGQHSGYDYFKSITHLGFYNPRLNRVYRLAVNKIPTEIIEEVEKYVIGY